MPKQLIPILISFSVLALAACGGGDSCNPQKPISIGDFQASAGILWVEDAGTTETSFTLQITPIAQTETADRFIRWSLWPNAYAQSCAKAKYAEKISYISVTSQSDYDDAHRAGESLNDLLVSHFGSEPFETHISGEISTHSSLDYLYVFTSDPTLSLEHQFEIEIILDTGAQFFISTEPVVFPSE